MILIYFTFFEFLWIWVPVPNLEILKKATHFFQLQTVEAMCELHISIHPAAFLHVNKADQNEARETEIQIQWNMQTEIWFDDEIAARRQLQSERLKTWQTRDGCWERETEQAPNRRKGIIHGGGEARAGLWREESGLNGTGFSLACSAYVSRCSSDNCNTKG